MAAKRKVRKTRKATTGRYVVSAVFRMKSAPISKTQADKLAKKARANGGTVTMKKV